MHLSLPLLVVASYCCLILGNEENLPRAPARTHLPTCDVFLAPSTIPGSKCMLFGLLFNFLSWITWLYRWYWFAAVDVYMYLKHSTYPAVLSFDHFHSFKFAPYFFYSWFRSFCRTSFQKRRDSPAELVDTVFTSQLPSARVPSELRLCARWDPHRFG